MNKITRNETLMTNHQTEKLFSGLGNIFQSNFSEEKFSHSLFDLIKSLEIFNMCSQRKIAANIYSVNPQVSIAMDELLNIDQWNIRS